ncbi:hypothetical protein LguiA_003956 [Lonicera macranthoides]
MMAHQTTQQNPQFLLDSLLYCEEQEEEEEDTHYTQNDQIAPHPSLSLQQDLFFQDEELASLFSKEQRNHLCFTNMEIGACLANLRREAVEWILRVVAHYSFSSITAVLAVNYVDRFIFGFQFEGEEKPWMSQLVAVSCLSLAAKFEETQVPLLLDLQVEESKYVFDAKTIKRMEILVLSTLEWKMNPVTPLSFLHHLTRSLGLNNLLSLQLLNKCESLLLSIISDCRLICYAPSVIATATMVYVINSIDPCIGEELQSQLPNILQIEKDKVEGCLKITEELYIKSRGFDHHYSKRKFGSSYPCSPKGVIDFSLTSDYCSTDSAGPASVSSSPEPPSKKNRGRPTHEIDENPP